MPDKRQNCVSAFKALILVGTAEHHALLVLYNNNRFIIIQQHNYIVIVKNSPSKQVIVKFNFTILHIKKGDGTVHRV